MRLRILSLLTVVMLTLSCVNVAVAQFADEPERAGDAAKESFRQPAFDAAPSPTPGFGALPQSNVNSARQPTLQNANTSAPNNPRLENFGTVLEQDSRNGTKISIQYLETVTVKTAEVGRDGKVTQRPAQQTSMKQVVLSLDQDLDKLDLPPDGKRIAVLTITARRHDALLDALKKAKTTEEKDAATKALEENYTEHYAIETWWREQKLKELEDRLKELRDQVKQRTDSEEKYVSAAMTIAGLHADGIAIAPPKPATPPGQTPLAPIDDFDQTSSPVDPGYALPPSPDLPVDGAYRSQ